MAGEQGTQEESGNAIKTSVSLPPYLSDWLTEVVQTKKFNSKSGAMVCALAEMKGRIEEREELCDAEPEKQDTTDENDLVLVLLKLLTTHKELIDEFNELRKKPPHDLGNTKKVKFE